MRRQGWVALAGMGCEVRRPSRVLLASAELALDRARRFGDVALETKALADGGLAHVQLWTHRHRHGDVGRGDGARVRAGRGVTRTAPESVCSFFTACYHAADFPPADVWAVVAAPPRPESAPHLGAPLFLSSHCDAVHATLLVELGRWHDAEQCA